MPSKYKNNLIIDKSYVDLWTITFNIPGYASQSKSDIPKLSSLNVITKKVFN